MSTVIKIGDRVTWQPRERPGRKNPVPFKGCKVMALYDDIEGRPAAVIDCGFFGEIRVFIKDIELEPKPDKTTILSGG